MNIYIQVNMKIKILWLDDRRDPLDPQWRHLLENFYSENIIWVKDFNQFIKWISSEGLPTIIFFDHDLADEHYTPEEYWDDYARSKAYQDSQVYTEKTGFDCAKWLVEYCLDNNKLLPEYYCHSFNPVGKDNILNLLDNFSLNRN